MNIDRMQAETCVFHSDRLLFKTSVRDLQRNGIIRRAQAPSVPMTVCSCRKKATFRQNLTKDQIWNAADHVITELDQRLSKLTTATNDLITSSANIARRSHSVTSYARFVVVISQALLGDVTLVAEEKRRCPKTRTSRPTHRVALNIVRRIINKKKQRCRILAKFYLPLFGGMTSALFRQPQIGLNFSRLCVSHACVLEIDSAATAEYMRQNKKTTVVSAWFSDNKVLAIVRRKLTTCALAVKKAHTERLRAAICYQNQLSDDFASLKLLDLKGILRGNFQQKNTGRERENRRLATNAPKPITRKDGSTYKDGHCLYCLIPFTLRENFCQEPSSCRHHPGYINKRAWTCCGQVAASSQPTHGDHSKDGCVMGRHLWRPHKTKARGYQAQKPKMYCKYFRQYKTRM